MATESTASAASADGGRINIGEVLDLLHEDFPSISIPKIRFLEEQGIVAPERTPSGYRKYSHADVERLRYALRLQRDHHQPLARIAEILDAIDRGLEPPPLVDLTPTVPDVALSADGFAVRDVGSLNGTYVNRDRIDETSLASGDEVQVGKYRLVYYPSQQG